MTLTSLATDINETTGYEGKTLEAATFLVAMLRADIAGNKAIGDYFQRRMRDSFEQTKRGA